MDDGSGRENRLAAARESAVRLLERRDLSEAELRERLRRRGHGGEGTDRLIADLRAAGYLDDRRVAENGILEGIRAGHASSRIDRKLLGRGVADAVLRRAWEVVRTDHDTDDSGRLAALLDRRLAREVIPLDRPAFRRVYNAMLRAGFDADDVAAALEPHLSSGTMDGHSESTTEPDVHATRKAPRSNDDLQ